MIDTAQLPLTKAQELVYNMDRFLGEGSATICGSILLKNSYTAEELQAAALQLISANDALHIRLQTDHEGKPMQVFQEDLHVEVPSLYFPHKEALKEYASRWAKEPLSPEGPLFQLYILQLPEHCCGYLIKLHHLIADAWTLSLLGSQLISFLNGVDPHIFSYADHVRAQQKYILSKRHVRDRDFFENQFLKCEEMTYLSKKQTSSHHADRITHSICGDDAEKLLSYAQEAETSPFILFLSAFAIYMSRVNLNKERFFIGTSVLNRNNIMDKHTAGMFVHTLPLLMELNNSATFCENVKLIENSVFSAFRHQGFHYGNTLELLRKEHQFKEPLYDVTLSYQNAAIAGGDEQFESSWYTCGLQTESLQIHIEDRDQKGLFHIHYDYLSGKFSSAEIHALHKHFITLLLDGISTNNSPKTLKLLSEEETRQLLHDFNYTAADFPHHQCIHDLIRQRAQAYPHTLAVQDRHRSLTYWELEEEASRIAGGLIKSGVHPGDIVAIALPKTCTLISAILGILKAGAAYLPIDSSNPPDRIRLLLAESHSAFYITEDTLEELLSEDPPAALPTVDSEGLCYCISTSGSTGIPKIVLIRHRNIVNTVYWKLRSTPATNLTTLCISPITADTFTEDIFFSLLSDRLLRLCDRDRLNEIAELITGDSEYAIMTTPTLFNSIRSRLEEGDRLGEVTLVGESLVPEFVQKIRNCVDVLYNEYGPSECAVCASRAQVSWDDDVITIGKPISNVQIYILDRHLQLVPMGAVGEICIAGQGVGCGYLGREDLTNAAFVANPYGPGKLYRTGDLALLREDGNILYIGRNDFQVKIRGLRIELEEIERTIASVPGVMDAAVVVRKDEDGRQVICAFYSEEYPVNIAYIKTAITDRLPRYMLPHIFTKLDALPGTASGKVDRKRLPEIDLHGISRSAVYEAPCGEKEQILASLWEKVLKYSPVGRDDHFFDVGGDSLEAIELISHAQALGISLSLQTIFDHPTIRELGAFLEEEEISSNPSHMQDFSRIHALLSANCSTHTKEEIPPTPMGDILLTGATGFLGIHVLREFLTHHKGIAYCPVRGNDERLCISRFRSIAEHYFGDLYSHEIGNRIRIIPGDLQKDLFGLDPATYEHLARQVQTVIHTAANVKHYGTYASFHEANVLSVERIVAFAKLANAKVIHASTTSVCGDHLQEAASCHTHGFSEKHLYIGQSLENVYVRSKFEGELVLLNARLQGLPIHIMRMGNLTNRRSDGIFQPNHESNAFLNRIRGILQAGAIPASLAHMPIEFTPVDEAAAALMTLSAHFDPQHTIFHIYNPHLISMNTLLSYFARCGYPTDVISEESFSHILRETAEKNPNSSVISAFIHDMDKDYRLHYKSDILLSQDFTLSRLHSLHHTWQEIDETYIQKYITYFRNKGLFEVLP